MSKILSTLAGLVGTYRLSRLGQVREMFTGRAKAVPAVPDSWIANGPSKRLSGSGEGSVGPSDAELRLGSGL